MLHIIKIVIGSIITLRSNLVQLPLESVRTVIGTRAQSSSWDNESGYAPSFQYSVLDPAQYGGLGLPG